ncbi:MAG: hypothetical protein IKJ73_03370, partial [Lachnospiraceae bacterium]|nr:hypothetical protein [Lachnospiraceae bacterium]
AGTSGESKRLESIQIYLTGEMAKHYDIYYRVHAESFGWLGWVKNGEPAGTAGYSKRLEAIQIILAEKNAGAPGNVAGISSVTATGFQYKNQSQIPDNPYVEPKEETNTNQNQSTQEEVPNPDNNTNESVGTNTESNTVSDAEKYADMIPEEYKVSNYTYKITPLVPPFNEFYFVETDHPNPNAFRFVDSDCEYFAVEDAECWILHQTYVRYVDVEYTDYETGRIHNGYIFSKQYDSETDGGTLMVQQGVNNYGDHFFFIDSEVTVECEPVKSKVGYLIDNCTNENMTYFEKLDAAQAEINKYSVYPESINDTSDVNENFPYPHYISGLHEDQCVMEQYDVMFGDGEDYINRLLVQEAHPFSLDSLGVPSLMGKVARTLEPDCTIKSTGSHYSYAITYDGETHYYGGSGSGSGNGIFTDVVEKLYYFDNSDKDFAANPSLASMSDKILEYGKLSDEKLAGYEEMLTGEAVKNAIFPGNWVKIREDYTGYEVYAYAGMFSVDTSYSFLSDTWVDGRYIDSYEIYEPGAKFEDHPNADIVIRNMTYRDVSGTTVTRDVQFIYYSNRDEWLAPYSYLRRNYYYSDTLDTLPDYMVLTREEVEAMDLDYNTDKLPESGVSCDGTVVPGTPFYN